MNLTRNPIFVSLIRWLASTGMFARPVKQLPGKWRLFEFYTEPEGQLLNMKEEAMKKAGYLCEITFEGQGRFNHKMNLPVRLLTDNTISNWQIARNFLKLSSVENPEIKEEFQFAISRGNLKLLQKDTDGKIIFFGFFRKIEVSI